MKKVLIVAGEASGDAHAARLVDELRAQRNDCEIEFFGAAGPRMRESGVVPIVQSDEFAIVGVAEIARALPMFWSAYRKLLASAEERRPNVAILVDFPDFNLRLARSLKKRGFCVIYYISPQLWAWRKYRLRAIRKHVDLLLAILPFEKEWYERHGFDRVEFVGNPLTNEVWSARDKKALCSEHGLSDTRPIIALLPGSRHNEIVRILPVMLKAALIVEETLPDSQFVIAVREGRNRTDVDAILAKEKRLPQSLSVTQECTYDVLAAADVAIVTSGTATLETGIIGTPMVIVYKTSLLNYFLLKPLISTEHYGLINLIAGTKVAAELIQGDFSPSVAAAELLRLLEPFSNARAREDLRRATAKLGIKSSARRSAEAILELIDRKSR